MAKKSIIADFTARSQTAKGNLDAIARKFIKTRGNDLTHCIVNNLPMYLTAHTQGGKTRYKIQLAHWALKNNLVDAVIVSTTNLTGAMVQMYERFANWGRINGYNVKKTDDKTAYMIKNDIFINMTNATRTNRIDAIVANAEQQALKYKKPMPRILVIVDEGEEFHECTKDSSCDIALNNLLLTRNRPNTATIITAKVSATLLSHLIAHGRYSSELGFLSKQQVFKLPVHPDYQGLNKPNFIEPILTNESEFSGDAYTPAANLRNTTNPRRLVTAIEGLVANQHKLEPGLVQIGNVVFGRTQDSHTRAGGMIARAFQANGRTVTIWDKQDFTALNQHAEVVVIVHNGTARSMSVANKLKLIAHHWNRSNLVAVVIVSKLMTGKSITLETEDCRNPSSPEYGFYANFTAYYGPGRENITTAIQAMRCTGIRPAIKKHVMWTTDDIKQEIESYVDQNNQFISHLNSVGSLSHTQIIAWQQGLTRPITKASLQKRLGNTTAAGRVKGTTISNSERSLAVQADVLLPVTAATRKTLKTTQDLLAYVQQQGFALSTCNPKLVEVRSEQSYSSDEIARLAYKNFTNGKLVKMHWTKIKGKLHLYAINNSRGQERVEYSVTELDALGSPTFSTSTVYQNVGTYLYKVA